MQQQENVQELMNLFNILSVQVTCCSPYGTSAKRVDGSEDVYKSTPAAFCDPKTFNPFTTARRQLERACLATGTRVFGEGTGFYGIPEAELGGLMATVKSIVEKVEEEKERLIKIWPTPVEEWAKAHPEEADEIRRIAISRIELESRLGVNVRLFKVKNQGDMLESFGIADGVKTNANKLCWQIASEIAQDVRETWGNKGSKTSAPLKGLREGMKRWKNKAKAMGFVDTRLKKVEEIIDSMSAIMPQSGLVEGKDFLMVRGMVSILASPENILGSQMELKMGDAEEPLQNKESVAIEAVSVQKTTESQDLFSEEPSVVDIVDKPAEAPLPYAW